jgi:transposase
MLTALCDKLAIVPCMRLKDIVTFLRSEFEVEVTRFSIRRALKDVDWSKKATQNIA